jgi:ADP-heptose:LPS heptosyltransferase
MSRGSHSSYASRSGTLVTKQSLKDKPKEKTRAILVTRNTGGIGDMLMITPAIRQIKKEHPNTPLIVNTTKQYGTRGVLFDVLKHNPYVDSVVESSELQNYEFGKIYNFNTQQEIGLETSKDYYTSNRIDIFLDLAKLKTDNYQPVYIVTEGEKEWAKKWIEKNVDPHRKTLIGIQIHTSTSKRSWVEEKCILLALSLVNKWKDVSVLLFWEGLTKVFAPDYHHTYNLIGMPFRWVAALMNECEALVLPDSGLLHLAGALGKKTVALFGSTPPESRISHYPNATGITMNLACSPCWYERCYEEFKCMCYITVDKVLETLAPILERKIERKAVKSIAILRMGGIGDLIMMTPTLRELRRIYPESEITIATNPAHIPVLKGLPYLNGVIPLQEAHLDTYESIIDLRWKVESPEVGGNLSTYLYKTVNRIDMFARLFEIEILDKKVDVALDKDKVENAKEQLKYNKKFEYLGIHVSTTSNTRTIPPEYIPELAKKFSKKGRKIVLIGRTEFWHGRKSEIDFPSIKGRNVINLVDKPMDVGDMIALFSLMNYIIAPDSVAVHIAGALDIPCIALFGNIDPDIRTRYYPTVISMYAKGELDCIPCWDFENPCHVHDKIGAECMRLLTPERIFGLGKEWG